MSGTENAEFRDNQNQDVIVIEDETLRQGFTQIPNAILRMKEISPGAKLAYMGLLSYAWQKGSCFPGQERLATDLGVSKRSIVTYLQQLKKAKLLRVNRRGLGKTNVYTLPKIESPDTSQLRSADSALQEMQNPTHQEVQNLHIEEYSVENTQKNNSKIRKVKPQEKEMESTGAILERRSPPPNNNETNPSDRDILAAYMQSIALELRDQAPLRSTVTRLLRIYERSRIDSIQGFVDVLYQARSITREHTSSIRGGEPGARRITPYFIAVVEDLAGLKGNDSQEPHGGP